jgi:sugar/nucleoside kinase (ribokinase family)
MIMKTVIVLGDLNLDIILAGMKDYPSLGKEIFAETHAMQAGGSAANVASVLAAAGCPVRLFGRLGTDSAGQYVAENLRQGGLDTSTIAWSDRQPTGITVSLTYPHDRMYISRLGTVASTTLDDLPRGYLNPGAHLHLASYFLQAGLRPSVGRLLKEAKEAGMSTSLDPGGDPVRRWDMSGLQECFRYLDWFLPNADEIRAITGMIDLDDAVDAFTGEVAGLVVKAGPQGAILRHQGAIEHYPGIPIEAIDTTCAGDCFDAGFLYGLGCSYSLSDAVALANKYGAEAASCVGLPLARIASLQDKHAGSRVNTYPTTRTRSKS